MERLLGIWREAARPYLDVVLLRGRRCAWPLLTAMLILGMLEVVAQATNIDTDTTINTTEDLGPSDVNVATGHLSIVTLTIDTGGTVTSTGSWHVGQASDTQGTVLVNTGGILVTEQLRLGDADAAQGTLDVNGGIVVSTPAPHAKDLAAVLLGAAKNATGIVSIHNGGELQTTGLSFGEPPEGPAPAAATLTLDNGTITALEDNPDFITHSNKVTPLTVTLGAGGGTINTQATDPLTHVQSATGVNIIINSPFSGPGSLTKLGLGTLTLTNEASDYTGGTNLGAFVNGGPDTINGGTLIAASPNVLGVGDVHLIHGTLATASFVPSGPTSSGFPPPTGVASTINIHGNLTTEVNSTLALGIGGTQGSQYDHLHVDGTTTLRGGTLFVASLKKFQPQAGDAFAVIQHNNVAQTTVFPSPGLTEVDDLSLNGNGNLHPLVFYLPNAVLLVYATEPSNIKLTAETEDREQQELRKLPAVPRSPATTPTPPTPPSNGQPPGGTPGSPTPLPPPQTEPGGPSTPGAEQQEHQEEQHAQQFVSNLLLPALTLNQTVPQSFLVRLFDPTAEELTSLYQAAFSSSQIQNSILNDHMGQIQRAYAPPPPAPAPPLTTKETEGKEVAPLPPPAPSTPRWSIWGSGWGNWVHIDTTNAALGYHFTSAGMSAGIDYLITPHFLVGAFGGYSHDWINFNPSGSVDADTGLGGIYASYWSPTGWYVNAAAYGGGSSYSTSRQATFGPAQGSSSGYQFSTFGESGYYVHSNVLGNELVWGPLVGISYSQAHVDGFDEHGSLVPLDIHADTFESLETTVGAQAYYTLHAGKLLITPGLKLGWGHEYKVSVLTVHGSAPALGGATGVFSAPNIGQDWLGVQAGAGFQINPRISITINYEGQLAREHSTSNGVTGVFSWSF